MKLVANIKRNEPFDIYIGRPSKWGNPFHIGLDGDRKTVIEKYRQHLFYQERIDPDKFRLELEELRGKVLGCFCSPLECHGDVLVELANKEK